MFSTEQFDVTTSLPEKKQQLPPQLLDTNNLETNRVNIRSQDDVAACQVLMQMID